MSATYGGEADWSNAWSAWRHFKRANADATAAAATSNFDARHCGSIGSDSRVQVNLNGAGSTLNWTLKNWFLFDGGFDIRNDTGGSIVNTGNANVFWEGSFESLDLDELLGGTGHRFIDLGGTAVSTCIEDYEVNQEDMRPLASSPLRGAGVNAGVTSDFDGVPFTTTPDVGAFQFVPLAVPGTQRLRLGLGIGL